jgi:two-component system, response regulator RegA
MQWSICGSSDGNGLDVVEAIHRLRPEARAVVLTGYGNIATAVSAVKLGAADYLSKPADADAVYGALMARDRQPRCLAGKPDVGRPGALGAHPAGL